jgi:hypothetical protein
MAENNALNLVLNTDYLTVQDEKALQAKKQTEQQQQALQERSKRLQFKEKKIRRQKKKNQCMRVEGHHNLPNPMRVNLKSVPDLAGDTRSECSSNL